MSELHLGIEKSILEHRLIEQGKALLVAVSGGLDSMVLLRVLHELAAKHAWRLSVAHFNHQLRGRSSDADERLVRATAKKLGLPYHCERGDVRQFAKANKLSIEMAARQLRHEFLARTARENHIATVALAHHADDQLELFFLRLLRGAGVEGLAGMEWLDHSPVDPQLRLIRPLLGTTKEQLREYTKQHRLKFREDATNLSLDYQRNRIRIELLPLLKKYYQPALSKVILRTMDILKAEDEFLQAEAGKCLRKRRGDFVAGSCVALQRRVLQLQLQELKLPADFEIIEGLRAGETVNIGPGISVVRDESGVIHVRKKIETFTNSEAESVDLSNDCGNVFFHDLRFDWQQSAWDGKRLRSKPGSEVFDAQSIGPKIILRHWQAGDRFQPIGMAVEVKLQDLFTNLKVPRAQRHKLVLAATGAGEIFWVEGLRIGERFKVRKNSKSVLHWSWQRLT